MPGEHTLSDAFTDALQIMPLVTRAKALQKAMDAEAVVRQSRSAHPAVLHRIGDVVRHQRCGPQFLSAQGCMRMPLWWLLL